MTQKAGSQITTPVTVFEYEEELNEKRRTIYLLKGEYIEPFMSDFRNTMLYKKSTNYVSSRIKKTN